MAEIEIYEHNGKCQFNEFMAKLNKSDARKCYNYINLLRNEYQINDKIIKKIKGHDDLYELRPDRYRIILLRKSGNNYLVISIFLKKDKAQQNREIEKASKIVKKLEE